MFVFKLASPDSAWTIDVKNGKGSVKPGAAAADTTLELSDEDFMAMTSGKADAMKLYMGGKLKIGGDVMASQKLSFLQKIDPKHAAEAIARKRGQAGAAPAPAVSPAASAPPANDTAPVAPATAPSIFKSLDARLKKNPGLAREIGAIVQFEVEKPSGTWTVDLTGEGSVQAGASPKATTKLRIADADLAALSKAADLQETARDLYQHGRLRVDGDMRPARKLMILKDAV